MKEITYLSWIDIEDACKNINNQILQAGIKIDVLVSIQRGGCIPGVILSHLLCVPEYYSIGIRTTTSEAIRSPRLKQPIVVKSSELKGIQDKHVLLIDDVTNTGKTLQIAKEEILEYHPASCNSAVLIWDGNNSLHCEASFYAKRTPNWVVFPWENHNI